MNVRVEIKNQQPFTATEESINMDAALRNLELDEKLK